MKRASLHNGPPAAILLPLLFLSCNHPAQFLPPIPGSDPRNFTWTIDTIAFPGSPATLMRSIWGSSVHDVYVAGHNDLPGGAMFHYDGSSWHAVGLTASEGGTIPGTIDLSQVLGFSGAVIFAVGGTIPAGSPAGTPATSLVIHFNGKTWSEMQVPPGGMLRGIWGPYDAEMWAVGDSGTLIQFISLTWIPATPPLTGSFNAVGGVSTADVYALSSSPAPPPHDTTFRYLWNWNGAVWSVADSFPQVPGHTDRFGTRSIWSLLAITYTTGQGLFKRDGSSWDLLVPGPVSGYLNAVYGTVNSSLFAVGDGSAVFQISPADWYRYPQFADQAINYYGVWTDGREVFVVGNDGRETYLLHGK